MAPGPLLVVLGVLIAIPLGIVAVIYLVVPLFKAIGWVFRQVFRFVFGEIGDALRFTGAIISQIFLIPLVIGNVVIGRWSASAHYGRAVGSEFKTAFKSLYRMAIGHPAKLFCLNPLLDGIEKRVPQAMAAAPGADRPSKSRSGQFDGYTIVGSLPVGGSGAKLYIANPDAIRLAGFARQGQTDVRQVVIKVFSLKDGSSLPQIVRESRALEAAKKQGLVLDHELSDERFYYVMKYVPGESLGLVTQRLHALAGSGGLETGQLRQALGYSADLLRTLDEYHRGGLWHKDVKPDNIIVDGRSAHLVDFGLVTPLRSGMTLTTHGTEYFRDPEMVRMALKGVKVHQVDGAKFDIYAAGAVLFSMVENSFPAHGGLSQISKRCPEALRWIVRRAMTEYDHRYASSAAMLADLEVVRTAPDPFAVRPAELPSMRGVEIEAPAYADNAPIRPQPVPVGVGAGSDGPAEFSQPLPPMEARAGSPVPPPLPPLPPPGRSRPKIRVNRWWTGGYLADAADASAQPAQAGSPAGFAGVAFGNVSIGGRPVRPNGPRPSACEQVESARARARAAQERAKERMADRRRNSGSDFRVFNPGVVGAVGVFAVAAVIAGFFLMSVRTRGPVIQTSMRGTPEFVAIELPSLGDRATILEGTTSSSRVVMQQSGGPRIVVNGNTIEPGHPSVIPMPPESPRPPAHPAKSWQGTRRVLVISDSQPPTPAVLSVVERLRGGGFTLLGNLPGATTDKDQQEFEMNLEKDAKIVRALGQLDAPDVTSSLSAWLAKHEELSLLVWFGTANADGRQKVCVFAPKLNKDASPDDVEMRDENVNEATDLIKGE